MSNADKDNKENISTSAQIYNEAGLLLRKYYNDPPIAVGWDLLKKIVDSLNSLYFQSGEENFYWTDCPVKVYTSTLEERLKYLQKKEGNPDLDIDTLLLRDFMSLDRIPRNHNRVLTADNETLPDYGSYNYSEILERKEFAAVRTKFEHSRKKKKEYVQQHFRKRGKEILEEENNYYLADLSGNQIKTTGDIQPVKWQGQPIQLAELIKALIEGKMLEGLTEKEIFDRFSAFFQINLNQRKNIQNIADRGDRGPEVSKLLPTLIKALENWNENRVERKLNNSPRK